MDVPRVKYSNWHVTVGNSLDKLARAGIHKPFVCDELHCGAPFLFSLPHTIDNLCPYSLENDLAFLVRVLCDDVWQKWLTLHSG